MFLQGPAKCFMQLRKPSPHSVQCRGLVRKYPQRKEIWDLAWRIERAVSVRGGRGSHGTERPAGTKARDWDGPGICGHQSLAPWGWDRVDRSPGPTLGPILWAMECTWRLGCGEEHKETAFWKASGSKVEIGGLKCNSEEYFQFGAKEMDAGEIPHWIQ